MADDDNVKPLKPGQMPNLVEKATNAINKARMDQFEGKIKEKVKLLSEQRKSVKITEGEIEALVEEFESGM